MHTIRCKVLDVNSHRKDSPAPARCERDVAGRLALCMKRQVTLFWSTSTRPHMPCTTPPSTSGSREPLGWTCRTVRSWTPWWTSPMPCGSWVYADGGPRTRQGSPVTAGRRTVPTPRSPTHRRQQQSSANWRRRNAQKMRFPPLRQSFLQGWQFFRISRSARLR